MHAVVWYQLGDKNQWHLLSLQWYFVTYMLWSFVDWMLSINIDWLSVCRVFQKDSLDGILLLSTHTDMSYLPSRGCLVLTITSFYFKTLGRFTLFWFFCLCLQSLQQRNIEDEIALCDKKIQKILNGVTSFKLLFSSSHLCFVFCIWGFIFYLTVLN